MSDYTPEQRLAAAWIAAEAMAGNEHAQVTLDLLAENEQLRATQGEAVLYGWVQTHKLEQGWGQVLDREMLNYTIPVYTHPPADKSQIIEAIRQGYLSGIYDAEEGRPHYCQEGSKDRADELYEELKDEIIGGCKDTVRVPSNYALSIAENIQRNTKKLFTAAIRGEDVIDLAQHIDDLAGQLLRAASGGE